MKSIGLLISGLISCTVMHIGCGTVIRKLMEKDKPASFIRSDNEQLQGIREDQESFNLVGTKNKMDGGDQDKEEANGLLSFFENHRELPQLIKAVIILVPPLMDFGSFIWELLVS